MKNLSYILLLATLLVSGSDFEEEALARVKISAGDFSQNDLCGQWCIQKAPSEIACATSDGAVFWWLCLCVLSRTMNRIKTLISNFSPFFLI